MTESTRQDVQAIRLPDGGPKDEPRRDDALDALYTWRRLEETTDNLALIYHENSKRYAAPEATGQGGSFWSSSQTVPADQELPVSVSANRLPPDSAGVNKLAPFHPDRLSASLGTILQARRSCRQFLPRPLATTDIADLCHAAYGVTHWEDVGGLTTYLHTVPSGGRRYPLEVYVVCLSVDGLSPGVYHYRPEPHVLESLRPGDHRDRLRRALLENPATRTCSAVFVISAVWHRNMDKYGERGYRGILLEAGAAMEHLALGAQALGLESIALEGIDSMLDDLVEADGTREGTLIAVAVGAPPTAQTTRIPGDVSSKRGPPVARGEE